MNVSFNGLYGEVRNWKIVMLPWLKGFTTYYQAENSLKVLEIARMAEMAGNCWKWKEWLGRARKC